MVSDKLDRLKDLQEILSRKYSLENELKELPKSLQTKHEILNRLKKTYLDKNQQYEDCRIRLVELRGLIEQAGKDRDSSEAMIVDISTQREYEALLKQIRDASDREQQFRRDLQREEKNYEELSQVIEREESMIAQQEEEYKAENEKIQAETLSRKQEIDRLSAQEDEISSGDLLDDEILFKFRRIIRKKEGKGIVPLRKGVCTGCNMILPMEFVNEVRKEVKISFCPYCSMILAYEQAGDNELQFDLTAFVGLQDDENSDDAEFNENLLMERAMKEGEDDDGDDESLGDEEDGLVEDEQEDDVIVEEEEEVHDDIVDDELDDSPLVEGHDDDDDDLDEDEVLDEEE